MNARKGTCRVCGEAIQFLPTRGGRIMPCELGVSTIVTAAGAVVRGFEPHFGNCPDWRAKKAGEAELEREPAAETPPQGELALGAEDEDDNAS